MRHYVEHYTCDLRLEWEDNHHPWPAFYEKWYEHPQPYRWNISWRDGWDRGHIYITRGTSSLPIDPIGALLRGELTK